MNYPLGTRPGQTATASVPRLRRVLTLWDLVFYGIVLIQPIAPVPLYGVAQKLSNGHFATIILIAMFAMMTGRLVLPGATRYVGSHSG